MEAMLILAAMDEHCLQGNRCCLLISTVSRRRDVVIPDAMEMAIIDAVGKEGANDCSAKSMEKSPMLQPSRQRAVLTLATFQDFASLQKLFEKAAFHAGCFWELSLQGDGAEPPEENARDTTGSRAVRSALNLPGRQATIAIACGSDCPL